MSLLFLISMTVYTVGAFAFGAALYLWVHAVRDRTTGHVERIGGAITLVCFAWFVLHLLQGLSDLTDVSSGWSVNVAILYLSFLFPPLIMHDTYVGTRFGNLRRGTAKVPGRPFGLTVAATYLTSHAFFALSLLGFAEVLPLSRETTGRIAAAAFSGLFILALIYTAALVSRYREPEESDRDRASRGWLVGLLGLAVLLFAAIILDALGWIENLRFLALLARSLPICFLFVGTYQYDQFRFFDLFIKRGISLLLTIVLLAAGLGLVFGLLGEAASLRGRSWLYALILLPLVTALPWIYRVLGQWLDNVWLGRRFTPVEALKHFLAALQSATSESELIDRAEDGLEVIFRAPVKIGLGLQEAPDGFQSTREIPIRSNGEALGAIRMGPRANDIPYFSQDLALLDSLADVFSSMLRHVRLQQKKQEQEREAKELTLQASRSELKALRAQINPHFLFNALNAIAGLIHRDPLRADKAVEQLADVFRYTLRRSNDEWALLDEELDFVESYLEVEQARFGERLEVRIAVDPAVRALRIPTMIVHTLAENAVKHGIAAVRGRGRIEIDAALLDDRLVVSVSDSGPGFAAPARNPDDATGGYGLNNVRQRLEGYFGQEAELRLQRDERRELTVVSILLPISRLDAASLPAGAAGGSEAELR